ncbi:MAG: hypothetical protein NT062_34585 [Proteobacteria bacterium]|nr:hypothetical protein [Pseudomonadota bacterium]
MTVRDELEAALRARWDRETLAVYADHLESIGEPRGELISIDLRIDETGATPALIAHRRALIDQWFGFQPAGVRHGFVDLDASSADPVIQLELLDGPAAPFVRSTIIVGAPATIVAALAKLSETERPWLTRLVIRQWSEGEAPTMPDVLVARLVRATPHLAHLEIDGRRVIGAFAHPAVRHARLSGCDAVTALPPGLTSLDFAFHAHLASKHEKKIVARVRDRLLTGPLPHLTSLDLSRNEPGYLDPDSLGGEEDVYGILASLALRAQLEVLRLPRLFAPRQEGLLRAALPGMPNLRELVVGGAAQVVGATGA